MQTDFVPEGTLSQLQTWRLRLSAVEQSERLCRIKMNSSEPDELIAEIDAHWSAYGRDALFTPSNRSVAISVLRYSIEWRIEAIEDTLDVWDPNAKSIMQRASEIQGMAEVLDSL